MASLAPPPPPARGRLRMRLLVLAAALGLLALAAGYGLPARQNHLIMPVLASVGVFLAFTLTLRSRVGDNLFGEIGFLYVLLVLAYTVFPALTFLTIDLNLAAGWVWEKLAMLLPAPEKLGAHLWRHVLFMVGISVGYLAVRGRKLPKVADIQDSQGRDGRLIVILLLVVVGSLLAISLLSAPVSTYMDNYTRFDHLPFLPRKFVSLCARLKQGFFVVLITFLFIHFRKYRALTLAAVAGMAAYEIAFSFGSRIESLIILLMAFCLYHYFVKAVTLKKGVVVCMAIAALFSAIEVMRAYDFDITQTRSAVSSQGMKPASELGAVYFIGYHLYEVRTEGTMPPKELPMFFNDVLSLVTPNSFVRWHPQYWYARAYFPDSTVPPQTMGPIADSAIWGGEADLLLRSLVNGMFFAYLMRWFIKRSGTWWGVAVFVFCYATCIMTLKYSVFWHLNPLFKTFLPVLLLVALGRRFLPARPGRPAEAPTVP